MIIQALLPPNRYSRSQRKQANPKGIVLHHGVNDHYCAMQTRNYFENLKSGKNAVYYSTHYVIGQQGEVLQCIPEDEVANHRGAIPDSQGHISITLCGNHAKELGIDSKNALKRLLPQITQRHALSLTSHVCRHCDLSASSCPHFFCQDSKAWQALLDEIAESAAASAYLLQNAHTILPQIAKASSVDDTTLQALLIGTSPPDATAVLKLFAAIAPLQSRLPCRPEKP